MPGCPDDLPPARRSVLECDALPVQRGTVRRHHYPPCRSVLKRTQDALPCGERKASHIEIYSRSNLGTDSATASSRNVAEQSGAAGAQPSIMGVQNDLSAVQGDLSTLQNLGGSRH